MTATLTDYERQQLIIDSVGDVDVNGIPTMNAELGVVAQRMELLWRRYASLPVWLREFYVERDAIDLVLARIGGKVDVQLGTAMIRHSQHARGLRERRQVLVTSISEAASDSNFGEIGQITQTTPIYPADPVQWRGENIP